MVSSVTQLHPRTKAVARGERTGRLLSAAASCEEYEPVTAEIHVNQVSTNTPGDQVTR